MELVQNIWTRYGFRGNPFDTAALSASAGTLLPIAQAIVGRGMDSAESKKGHNNQQSLIYAIVTCPP